MTTKPPGKEKFKAPLKGNPKHTRPPSSRVLYLVMALVAVVILVGGYLFYHFQEQQMRQRIEGGLSIVVQLKVDQIAEWRAERLTDADMLVGSPFFAEGVEKYLASPTDTEIKDKILARLAVIEKAYPYQDILLVDVNGKVLLSLNDSVHRLSDMTLAQLAVAIKAHKAVITDFHYLPDINAPHLDVVAPLFPWGQDSPQAIGAVVFCIDPSQYLYPLVQSSPMPSETAETLLVERDGDQVLFLNELRYQKDTALKLRIPLSQQEVPAVMAVLGKEGTVEGKDYRGVKVLAALKHIPDSPWYMVAKIDTSEALSAGRSRSGFIITSVVGLLAAALAGAGFIWQRRQRLVYQALYQAEEALRLSMERYRILFDTNIDGLCVMDETMKVLLVNEAAARIFGFESAEEVLEVNPFDFISSQERERVIEIITKDMFESDKKKVNEFQLVNKSGKEVWVSAVGAIVEYQEKPAGLISFRDITERMDMEEYLRLSEQNFRDSIENSPLGIRIADSDGKTLYANRALLDIWGYSSIEELEAVPRKQRYTPESYDEHRERTKKRRQGEFIPTNYEISIVRKDGDVRHLAASRGEVLWDGEKQFQVVYQDITERKKLEQEIKHNYDTQTVINSLLSLSLRDIKLEGILEHTIDLILSLPWLTFESQGNIFLVEDDPEVLIMKARKGLSQPIQEACARVPFGKCLCGRAALAREIEFADCLDERHETRYDGIGPHGHYCMPIIYTEKVLGVINLYLREGYSRDEKDEEFLRAVAYALAGVIVRKQAEEKLRENEEKLRLSLNATQDGLWDWDITTNKEFFSPRWCEIIGYTFDDPEFPHSYDSWASRIHPEDYDHVMKSMNSHLEKGTVYDVDYRHLHKSGEYHWQNSRGQAIFDQSGKPIRMVGCIRDITERKQAEEVLKESEQRLKEAQTLGKIGNWEFDLTTQEIEWSDEVYELYERDKALGPPAAEEEASYYSPKEAKRLREFARLATEKGEELNYDLTAKLPSGKTVLFNASMLPVKDEKGRVIKLFGTIQDVTEHKRAEEALRESEEKYRSVVERANDGICIIQDGTIKYLNVRLANMWGGTAEKFVGAPFAEHLHPGNVLEMGERYKRRMAGDDVTPLYELALVRSDGSKIYTEVNAGVITYEGKPADLVILRDITERKRAEETLRQSEERYRAILKEIADSYFEVDLAGNLTFVNDATCRNLGYSKEELLGMNYRGFTAEESIEHVYQAFNAVYRTGEPNKGFLWKLIRKDGSIGFADTSASLLRSQTGEIIGFRGVGRDITERKMAEEERKQLELKAQITSRLASVGEMAAGVAHEINNPLTAVTGYAQLLVGREDIPSDIRSDLEAINDGARRVAGVVRTLLAFSRQTKPERKLVDINELMESTLVLRAYHLRVNNIEVITRLVPDVLETVVDPGQIQQVILNLIVNAETEMKLAHGKGKLTITTKKSDNTIKICFQDNGPGIKPEVMNRIFDPFFTTREVGEGTGLGLSLCYGIVTEHKGKIYAESKPGKGATFVVELPVVTEVAPPKPAEPDVKKSKKAVKARILVVDDEQVVRDVVNRVLTGEGHKVDAVDNAVDALKKIESQRYKLILVDIKMPGMNGVELYKRIQKIDKSLARRVVFITGDVMGADTEKFLSETKVAHIDKPFNAEQLSREVQRALTAGR